MSAEALLGLSSVTAAAATFTLAWLLLSWATRPEGAAQPGLFEADRRARLRAGSRLYRAVGPLVERLARWNRRWKPERLAGLARDLRVAAGGPPWLPEEYLAVQQVAGALAGAAVVPFGLLLLDSPPAALLAGALGAWGYQWLMIWQVRARARRRLRWLKERLPFAVDLMALMLEAGAGFEEGLVAAVGQNRENPLGEELGQVLRETEGGLPLRQALLALQERLRDKDVSDLVFALVKGGELGTPLSEILRTRADQARLRRSQALEKEAAEAQVAIVFPGLVVMVACLLITAAPFLLRVVYRARR